METIRTILVTVEVQTNKRTETQTREVDELSDIAMVTIDILRDMGLKE